MTKDPVCGMQVDEKKAPASSVYKGAFYAFCGPQCKDKFDRSPERFTVAEGNLRADREPQRAI